MQSDTSSKITPSQHASEAVAAPNPDVIRPLHAPRGMFASLADGWRMFALRPGIYFWYMALPALLVGIFMSIDYNHYLTLHLEHFQPQLLLAQAGYPPEFLAEQYGITTTDLLIECTLFILFVLAWNYARAFVWCKIIRYDAEGEWTKNDYPFFSKLMLRTFWRLLLINIVFSLIGLLFIALFVWLSFWQLNLWWLIGIVPFEVFLVVAAVPARHAFVEEGWGVKDTLRVTWREGVKHWGTYFVLLLLTGIPVVAVGAALTFGIVPYIFGSTFANESIIFGTDAPLPTYVKPVTFVVFIIGMALTFIVSSIQTWTLSFRAAAGNVDASAAASKSDN